MKKWFKIFLYFYVIALSVSAVLLLLINNSAYKPVFFIPAEIKKLIPSPTPTITLQTTAPSKILVNDYHIYQTFNNCGPAALSMALSYYGANVTQQALGQELRPYQNQQGDNDDKSVTLEELAEKSKDYGLVPYHRPNGNIQMMKLFIAHDIPIIARTLTKANEDIGHYRVVKGYDSAEQSIIQDDSLQGKNLNFPYDEFNVLWKRFNYEYLVLVPTDKVEIAEQILGEDVDEKTAWIKAIQNSEKELTQKPKDIYTIFNLSVAFYNVGNYQRSVEEFEKVEHQLPFRTLWYQIEPIKAYYELQSYDRVFVITDKILNTYNRAFSELYIIRGNIYLKQGNIEAARQEFEKAVFYNSNLKPAQEALSSLN